MNEGLHRGKFHNIMNVVGYNPQKQLKNPTRNVF